MMKKGLVSHEKYGDLKQFEGRNVVWVHTSESTGGRHCSVCMCTYEPGARQLPAHSHPKGEETIFVASGSGKVKIGGEFFALEPGSLALFPQGVPHIVWNTGDSPLKLCCFYAPCAEAVGYVRHEDFDFDECRHT